MDHEFEHPKSYLFVPFSFFVAMCSGYGTVDKKLQLADAPPDSPVQKACFESSRLFPYTFSETMPQMVQCARSEYWLPGFGGLIQGQIYNPDVVSNSFVGRPNFRMN